VGIVGCGYAAEHLHLPALRSLPSVEVVALVDTDPRRLERLGARFAIGRRYADHEALLHDDEVDAVAVCVPPRAHATVVLAALDARKHVLVEKPLCLDLDEADRLVARARRSAVTAMVGFNLRYHRHVLAARQAIASGRIGQVELLRTTWSSQVAAPADSPDWRRRRELGGGVLNDLAVHHVDLWRFLLGSEVDQVFALACTGEDDDQAATLTARLNDGALAVAGFSHRAAGVHEIEVCGRQGRILVSPYRFDGFDLTRASTVPAGLTRRTRAPLGMVRALPGAIAAWRHGGTFLEAYRTEWQHFAEQAARGAPAACTFDDGRRALELVLGAFESIQSGRPVLLARRHRSPEHGRSPA
jgi:predicted dehydrogenase